MSSGLERAFLACCVIVVVVYIFCLLFTLIKNASEIYTVSTVACGRFVDGARAALSQLLRLSRTLVLSRASSEAEPAAPKREDHINLRIAELVESRRRVMIRQAAIFSGPFQCLMIMPFLYNAIVNEEFGYRDHVPKYANGGFFEMAMFIVLAAVCLIFPTQPGRPLRIFYHIVTCFKLGLSLLEYSNCLSMIYDRAAIVLIRMMMFLLFGEPTLGALLHVVLSLVMCLRYSYLATDSTSELLGQNHVQTFMSVEGVSLIFFIVVGFLFQFRLSEEARATIEAGASQSVSGAVKNVLGGICDVVLELDCVMKIMDDAQSLSVMLLRESRRSLKGSSFAEMLADESDRQKLHVELTRTRETSNDECATVIPFHVRMKDSVGNKVEVQVFQCPYTDRVTNVTHHMVGLREYGDFASTFRMPRLAHHEQDRQGKRNDDVAPGSEDRIQVIAKKGTPLHSQKEELVSASSGPSERSGDLARRLAVQEGASTSPFMMQYALTEVSRGWNVPLPRAYCCVYHAYMRAGQNSFKSLGQRACRKKWGPHDNCQCKRCDMMHEDSLDANFDEGRCAWCADIPDTKLKAHSNHSNTQRQISINTREHIMAL
eukprot:TRINITY_DN12704_c0_g2_i2.p1 TRINITY_DN12704_c0_g2~~TRINITY_DN12704_c0_g2_i2.p1  ORF type:complete len:621 (-),score=84.08 TRINITY_DN12704_c0_g2_i2:261-2063(-)